MKGDLQQELEGTQQVSGKVNELPGQSIRWTSSFSLPKLASFSCEKLNSEPNRWGYFEKSSSSLANLRKQSCHT